ncbi:MAG: SDR family oxidoreductase [Bacteroidetes bacterium]|nr:SDR family oxidoreductase [Bacteroidota bacterium]
MATALITGASGGIGLEIAKLHASRKGNLVLVARSQDKLLAIKNDLEQQFSIQVEVIIKDLTMENAAQEIYDYLKSKNIVIDYLINNAGFGEFGLFTSTPWEKEKSMMDLNMIALTHLTKLFALEMQTRRSGKILNIASNAAFQPGPSMAIYYATKAYVYYFSSALYNELKPFHVSVTSSHPGPVETGFMEASNLHTGNTRLLKYYPILSAEFVAKESYNAMLKGKRIVIPGFLNKVNAFFSKILPWSIVIPVTRWLQGSSKSY